MINTYKLVPFCITVFGLLMLPVAFADESEQEVCTENCSAETVDPDIERPKFYKEIEPDVYIDFTNDHHWEGLSTNGDYWKIKDGEGHFFLYSREQQLNGATYDILPLLEEEVGTEWILRYKLKLDNYDQVTGPSWSELLIGLSDSNANGGVIQWSAGVGFLNGAKIKYTNLMFDYGSYNEWHCCPMKGELKDERSLPGENKTWWIEYVLDGETFTVRLFEDSDYKNLIEEKSVTKWAPEGLRFIRIFPLVEDNTVNGYMYGRIDDIKFYNHVTTVYQPDKMPLPEAMEPKTMEETLKEAYGSQYVEPEPIEPFSTDVPEWFKNTISLWANNKITDDEFYSTFKDLVINEQTLVEELSAAYGDRLDLTYKPQTISIPKNENCLNCVAEDFVTIQWQLPDGLPREANAVIDITTPEDENIRLSTGSSSGILFRITSDFTPGLYDINITYGLQKFGISPIMLTEQDIPKIPFWVKYNSQKWIDGELSQSEFVDSMIFLIQNGEITFDPKIFIKKESKISATPEEMLEKFFPTQEEVDELQPPIWEYFSTSDALSFFNMDYVSVQKILEDRTRVFDPIYNKYDFPFTMMQIFQFDSNKNAKSFLEEQIWAKNVIREGTISDEEITYDEYKYIRMYEEADISGTSESTGDCLYFKTTNAGASFMDDTHFVQCVLHENVIQVYLYEDYPAIDEKTAYKLMDIILQKINDTPNIVSVENVLNLNNMISSFPSDSPSSTTPSGSESSSPNTPERDTLDPEMSGSMAGIQNFSCKRDDFGTVNMYGQYVNGENSFERVAINIVIESYDGMVLAQGQDYVLKINPYETRHFEAYVFLDEPFYKCNAMVDWDKSS